MFGLTEREQRWKAEQEAAKLMVDLIVAVITAATVIKVAEKKDGLQEITRLREENENMKNLIGILSKVK